MGGDLKGFPTDFWPFRGLFHTVFFRTGARIGTYPRKKEKNLSERADVHGLQVALLFSHRSAKMAEENQRSSSKPDLSEVA